MRTPWWSFVLSVALVVLMIAAIREGTGQNSAVPVGWGSGLPATCTAGDVFTLSGASPKFYQCTAANTWTQLAGGGGVPSGAVLLILNGTCPAGFVEAAALDGVMLRGTLAAHGDIGTTGGADTITPAGTNSLTTCTFTGTKFTTSGSGTPADSAACGTTLGSGSNTITLPAPTFTGTSFDNRPAFVKVIFCQKS